MPFFWEKEGCTTTTAEEKEAKIAELLKDAEKVFQKNHETQIAAMLQDLTPDDAEKVKAMAAEMFASADTDQVSPTASC